MDQFQCKDLECVPGILQCNGREDCRDGSDELDCLTEPSSECDPKLEFACAGSCIPMDKVCDNKNDCGRWEDEPSGPDSFCSKCFLCKL